jgi:ribonuclease VapC
MVIDTSAVLAILLNEPDAELYEQALEQGFPRLMSAASLLEASIVMRRRFREPGEIQLDLFVQKAGIDVVPFDSDQLEWARHGFRRYGKGLHPASLNYGDCCAYALSRVSGEPLLFKGNDFEQTDVRSAL